MNGIKHTWIVACSGVMTDGELHGGSLFLLPLFMTKRNLLILPLLSLCMILLNVAASLQGMKTMRLKNQFGARVKLGNNIL